MSSDEGRVISAFVARLRRMDDDEIEETVLDFIDGVIYQELKSFPGRVISAFFSGLVSGAATVGFAWWMLG